MQLSLYQVDAFADRVFTGNPAAVCPLEQWLPDTVMQQIAAENNLSETAFFVPEDDGYRIRWFTPTCEVALCGHATLAAAFVLFDQLEHAGDVVRFVSQSGPLSVQREQGMLALDFPVARPGLCSVPPALVEGLGATPQQLLAGEDYLAVFATAAEVAAIRPDLSALRRLDRRGVIVTAPGDDCDFVSRFFAPNYGIDEDPVTGSAHCLLAPYWAARLGRETLLARQLSARGGTLHCRLQGERISIAGNAVLYLHGTITLS